MSVTIYAWADAPLELRKMFKGRKRQWLAHIPEGDLLPIVDWKSGLEVEDRENGGYVMAGTVR